jgi:hypothetical protein
MINKPLTAKIEHNIYIVDQSNPIKQSPSIFEVTVLLAS